MRGKFSEKNNYPIPFNVVILIIEFMGLFEIFYVAVLCICLNELFLVFTHFFMSTVGV